VKRPSRTAPRGAYGEPRVVIGHNQALGHDFCEPLPRPDKIQLILWEVQSIDKQSIDKRPWFAMTASSPSPNAYFCDHLRFGLVIFPMFIWAGITLFAYALLAEIVAQIAGAAAPSPATNSPRVRWPTG